MSDTQTRRAQRCGNYHDGDVVDAVAWIEWKCTGRQKGNYVCAPCLAKSNEPDNFGDRLMLIDMLDGSTPPPHGDQPHPTLSWVRITESTS